MAEKRRLALVMNARAGAALADDGLSATLTQALTEGGADIAEPPEAPLPERLRAAAGLAGTVLVAGGDGTMACAAAEFADTETILGILPAGTMNLLAKDLGLPVGDGAAAARVALAGVTRRIDVGMAGDTPFLCACMVGSPARLGRHREGARHRGKIGQWLALARAAVRVWVRHRSQHMVLEVDGVPHALRTRAVTITLGPLSDESDHAFGRTTLESGVLCAYVVRRAGLAGFLRVFWRLARGQRHDPALLSFRGARMRLSGRGAMLRVMVDGEVAMLPAPVTFSVRPRALRVLVPGDPA